MKTYQQLDENEAKLFWNKIWQWKEYNRKAECINNMKKELKVVEKGLEAIIYLKSLRAIQNKVPSW